MYLFNKIIILHFRFLFLLSALFLTTFHKANACDVCVPSAGGNYVGVLPQFQKNFVGIRWTDRAFSTSSNNTNKEISPDNITSRFTTLECWARFYPHSRVQLIALLPYSVNNREESNKSLSISGLGDAVILANYTAIVTPDSSENEWRHQVLIGGGIKLPTGNFSKTDNGTLFNPYFQLGTGSYDFLANANYIVRYKKLGLRTDINYKYNTNNKNDYRFGDRISNNNCVFLWEEIKSVAIVPQIGIYQEFAMRDVSEGYFAPETGGTSRMISGGAEIYFSRIACGISYMQQVQQPKYDTSVKMNHNFKLQIIYFL